MLESLPVRKFLHLIEDDCFPNAAQADCDEALRVTPVAMRSKASLAVSSRASRPASVGGFVPAPGV